MYFNNQNIHIQRNYYCYKNYICVCEFFIIINNYLYDCPKTDDKYFKDRFLICNILRDEKSNMKRSRF